MPLAPPVMSATRRSIIAPGSGALSIYQTGRPSCRWKNRPGRSKARRPGSGLDLHFPLDFPDERVVSHLRGGYLALYLQSSLRMLDRQAQPARRNGAVVARDPPDRLVNLRPGLLVPPRPLHHDLHGAFPVAADVAAALQQGGQDSFNLFGPFLYPLFACRE